MKIHKMRKISGRWVAECGFVLTNVSNYHKSWFGVTCKNCLRSKPKSKVHYVGGHTYWLTACLLGIASEFHKLKTSSRWSKVTCLNCQKSGGKYGHNDTRQRSGGAVCVDD